MTTPLLDPGPIADTIGFRLRVAQIAAFREFEGALGRYGKAPRYLGLLGIIEANPGQPQSRLAEAVSLKRSSLVPIIDRLEADRLVERRSAPGDRRLKAVWLTPRGRRVLAELCARAQVQEERLAHGMSAAERRTLMRLLARVAENLERA